MATTFSSVVNNFVALAASSRSVGGTSLVLSTVDGLPTLPPGGSFRLSVFRNSVALTILRVTAINTGTKTLTISGAVEMADADVIQNDVCMVSDTAGLFGELQTAINGIEFGTTTISALATGSSVARTLPARFSEMYNVLDWGATGNGTTDDAPALNALFTHLLAQASYTPRTIYFPAGNYAVYSRLVIAKALGVGTPTPSIRLLGEGPASQITSKTSMTEILRIEDGSNTSYEQLSFVCGSAVSVAALHVTAITSGHNNAFTSILVDCAGNCPVGIGVNLDSEAANTQVRFLGCIAKNSTIAGVRLGSGDTGDAYDIQFSGCQVTGNQVGVWLDGAPVTWRGGGVGSNSIHDFLLSASGKGPTIIEGFCSVGSNMLFRCDHFGEVPPIRISDIHVKGFTGTTYNRSGNVFTSSGVEGFAISHRGTGVLTISNCSFWGGPPQYPGGRLDVNSPCNTVLINCEITGATQPAANLAATNYAFGGKGTGKNYSILGGRGVTTGDTTLDSAIDFWSDGPAFFNDTVAINTTTPTAQFHQKGGSFRMEQIADPVAAPVIANVGTPGSTTYTYWYIFKDQVKNVTKISPAGSTTTGNATLDGTNYNTVQMPIDNSVSYVDILRNDQSHAVVIDWNPYSSPYFQYRDQSMATSAYGPISSRNTTADMTLDGAVTAAAFNFSQNDVSASTVLATGSTTARTLAARFFSPFNVLDWGVTGAGSVDDQPAIMALLRYISNLSTSSSVPRTVYFPAGTYLIGSASNSQGIMCGRAYLPKADNSAWAVGTGFHAIHLVGDGYNTTLQSNCPTGITEILRMEDCPVSSVRGFRLLAARGFPVTRAAFHAVATISAENFVAEDVFVETSRYEFSIDVVNGSPNVAAHGAQTWPATNIVGKYLLVAGDTTSTPYLIDSATSTTMVLHTNYAGTTGQTTARLQGDGVPIGIGIGLDYPNDSAQFQFVRCKASNCNYAGIAVGTGVNGNVLDIRFYGCQSLTNPIGILGLAAPFIFETGALTFNYYTDICHLNCGGPIKVENIRSEGSNQFYVSPGGGTSLAPVTLSNSSIVGWGGCTYSNNVFGKLPYYTSQVNVTLNSPTVTGIGTTWKNGGRFQYIVGQKLYFQSDTIERAYTIQSIDTDTQITLSSNYLGPSATNTGCTQGGPEFAMTTQLGLDGTVGPVTATNGSSTVTGPAGWTTGLIANRHYLTFDEDVSQMPYSIASVDSTSQVTLGANPKGFTTYQGLTGLTRVKCGAVEGYALVGRSGGIVNLSALMFKTGPTPYGYARWNFSASNCFVTSIGCSTGSATQGPGDVISNNFFGSGTNLNATAYTVLPGPAVTSTGTSLAQQPLGFLSSWPAVFNRTIALSLFQPKALYGFHQQGGSMRVQSIPNPSATPTVVVQGSAGLTTYYYKYIFRDYGDNQTLPGPSSLIVNNSQPYTNFSNVFNSGNCNKVTIPITLGTSNPCRVDILRSTDNATWYSVVQSTTSGAILLNDGVTYAWNPFVTNAANAASLIFYDYSTTAPIGPVVLPTRNGTADATFDGHVSMNGQAAPYPGSGGTEINGAQTSAGTYGATEQKMLQTVYNIARAFGLLA